MISDYLLKRTNSAIDFSDAESTMFYFDDPLYTIVSEIYNAITNKRTVSLRFETPTLSFDSKTHTKITGCRQISESILFETPEGDFIVNNPEFGEGHPANNAFKFYVKNQEIIITVVIYFR